MPRDGVVVRGSVGYAAALHHYNKGDNMTKGTVKWFSDTKGYGFISPDDGSREVFVHHTAIEGQSGFRTLSPGDRVKFTPADKGRGPQAQQVRKIGLADDGLTPLGRGEGVKAVQHIAARYIDWQVVK